jgi:ABC-type bacteriocin/lantibiotic exporter with double-glycine peptidase domain
MKDSNHKSWAWSFVTPYWYFFVVLLLLSLAIAGTTLVLPYALKVFADYIFGNQTLPHRLSELSKNQLLIDASVVFLGIYVLRSLLLGLNLWVVTKMQQTIDKKVMLENFATLSSVPFNNPKRLSPDDSLYLINEQSRQVSSYTVGNFAIFSRWTFVFIGVIAVMANVSPLMAEVAVVAILLTAIIATYASIKFQVKGDEAEAATQATRNFIEDSLVKLRLVQEYAKEKAQIAKLEALTTQRDKEQRSEIGENQIFKTTAILILSLTLLAVLTIDGKQVLSERLTAGDILLFVGFLAVMLEPLTSAATMFGQRREQTKILHELYDNLEQAKAFVPKSGSRHLDTIKGKIELRHVKLQGTYKLIFTDLNLVLEPKSTTAVIGASGSGKSSLLSLFNGFMSPTEGQVLLDDVSLSELDSDFLRSNVAVVDQESLVMRDTIGNNIAFADPARANNLPDIMAAAVVNNATEFINSLDKKYDTPVEEDLLSGGQKQRISIARAYYAKTPIVIMDEPTAALDRRSAEIFADDLSKYFGSRTVLIATHDLALLRKVKNVYILQDKMLVPVPDLSKLDLEKYRIVS